MGACMGAESFDGTLKQYQKVLSKMADQTTMRDIVNMKYRRRNSRLAPDRVIEFDNDVQPLKAFNVLMSNNIRAAPVYNKETKAYEGVLDVRDIVKYAVAQYDFRKESGLELSKIEATPGSKVVNTETLEYEDCDIPENTEGIIAFIEDGDIYVQFEGFNDVFPCEEKEIRITHTFQSLNDGSGKGLLKQVENCVGILYLARMRPFVVLKYTDSVTMAMKWLSNSTHMIGLRDSDQGPVDRIVGQSEIFNWMVEKTPDMSFRVDELMKFNYFGYPVSSHRHDAKAIEAFQDLAKTGLSSLLIEKQGVPIGVISSTDIRIWLQMKSALNLFEQNCENFATTLKEKQSNVITCREHEICQTVLQRITKNSIHRIFIQGEKETQILGVFSITDFFRFCFLSEKCRTNRNGRRLSATNAGLYSSAMGSIVIHEKKVLTASLKQQHSEMRAEEKRKEIERLSINKNAGSPDASPLLNRKDTIHTNFLDAGDNKDESGGTPTPVGSSTPVAGVEGKDRFNNLFQTPDRENPNPLETSSSRTSRKDKEQSESELLMEEEEKLLLEEERKRKEASAHHNKSKILSAAEVCLTPPVDNANETQSSASKDEKMKDDFIVDTGLIIRRNEPDLLPVQLNESRVASFSWEAAI